MNKPLTSLLGSFGASGFDTAPPTHHRPSTMLADCPERAQRVEGGDRDPFVSSEGLTRVEKW